MERPGPAQSQLPVADERLKWEAADRDMRASLSNLQRSGSKGPWQALSRAMGGKLPASQPDQATAEQMEQLREKLAEVYSLLADQRKQMDRRLTILELLATYDYR